MNIFLKFTFVAAFFAAFSTSLLKGDFRTEMLVSYETRFGYSDWHQATVSFASGRELNNATRSFKFDVLSNYAMIWFDRGKVAILEIQSPMSFGSREFNERTWRAIFGAFTEVDAIQVNGDSEMQWLLKKPLFNRNR